MRDFMREGGMKAGSGTRACPAFIRLKGEVFHAFTLVELIVTISIAVVLIALIAAGGKKVLDSSKAAKCLGNMRQIAVAFRVYLQNNNDIMPQRYYGNQFGYPDLILPYCDGEGRIFQCPSQPKNNYPAQPSYGMNWYYDNISVHAVESSSRVIMLAETLGESGTGSRRADRNSITPGELDKKRHGNKSHYLFFDGHIEFLAWNDTVSPVDMWGVDFGNHSPTSD